MITVRRALVSVTDKTGIVEFVKAIKAWDVKVLSTGGTARLLRENHIEVLEVSQYTGFPEIMEGRVKTLHPKIHGGILAVRANPQHRKALTELGIEPIDMVVVNLYAFSETISRPGCSLQEAIENIDIGGPTLIRAAAKNFHDVVVVTDPEDYPEIIKEMDQNKGRISRKTSFELAKKAFCLTHSYDGAICRYLTEITLTE